jgi:PEP-CTERM motif
MSSLRKLAAALAAASTFALPVQAATWHWQYDADGIAASGRFTTADTPDTDGFYAITGISGTRNGVAITGLQPAGTAVPGNDPYAVDDLVAIAGPQLTWNGFGYALADGSFANPFSDGEKAWEYLSVAPYPEGDGQEVAVRFQAAPVPEPATAWLALAGLAGIATLRRARSPRG